MPLTNRVNALSTSGSTAISMPTPNRNSGKPKLGQHFLADHGSARKIVDALGDISNRIVIEIGPGRGALTDSLAQKSGHLIAVELDRVLAAQLRMKYSRQSNIEILEADVLRMDFEATLGPGPGRLTDRLPHNTPQQARVVGNIPYYITSDILLRLFHFNRFFDQIVLMIQKEVADRLLAQPGTSEYGILSATAQLYSRIEKIAVLPPGAFSPPPKVHSTVIRLTMSPQIPALGVDEEGFIRHLRLSFGQKRKTLVNNLKAQHDQKQIRTVLKNLGVPADIRAEALPLAKAAEIYRGLTNLA